MTFEAIIFDMDGLLVDSETVWLVAETDVIESHGHRYTDDVRNQIVGLRMDEIAEKLHKVYQLNGPPSRVSDEITANMLELIPDMVETKPGAKEIVAFVEAQDIPHAIASSSSMAIIDATLKAQGWDDSFVVRCTAEDEPRGKPAPDVYLTAARRLGVAPDDCLALEDSPNGARAAVAAGMTCYAVPDTSHSPVEAFKEITPHTFNNLHDVLAALKRIYA